MRGRVVVEEQEKNQAWLEQQPTFAQISARSKTAAATDAPRP
jgi:heme/copper-type cytochrome/quinol oxidase subunit 2